MRTEKGVTIVGALMGIIVFIFAAILLMKVLPVYIKNYELKSSISALKKLDATNFSDDPSVNVDVLKNKLTAQLNINGLDDDIKPEYISIKSENDGKYRVRVKYQVIRPLFYNVSLLFDFDDSDEVQVATN